MLVSKMSMSPSASMPVPSIVEDTPEVRPEETKRKAANRPFPRFSAQETICGRALATK